MIWYLGVALPIKSSRLKILWLIIVLFVLIVALEFSTPPEYVFGYLYTGPILLANSRLSRRATFLITLLAVSLTILNLWFPGGTIIKISTIVSRLIAVIALIVTAILSDAYGGLRQRNHYYEKEIAAQQAQLHTQEQLARIREDFASTLTHDLKTPLLGTIETLNAFQEQKFGSILPAQEKVLTTIIRSHQTSVQLVETLLDVYRNDTKGLCLQLASVDLVVLAMEVAATLSYLAASRRVYISVGYGESDFRRALWVNGDKLQIQRVFTNLITNAINHSRRGGKVEIILETQTNYQVVKILDNGPGITALEMPNLFERFYQGHSNRQAKGSGLGLYLSRQIIEAHGGIIWAENRFPSNNLLQTSVGAIFGFKLPVYTAKI